jgi:hypothetical protein
MSYNYSEVVKPRRGLYPNQRCARIFLQLLLREKSQILDKEVVTEDTLLRFRLGEFAAVAVHNETFAQSSKGSRKIFWLGRLLQ